MKKTISTLMLLLSSSAFAVPAEVWCYSENKLIFHKKAESVTYEKDVMIAHSKIYSYAVFNSDCIIKYKHKDLIKH